MKNPKKNISCANDPEEMPEMNVVIPPRLFRILLRIFPLLLVCLLAATSVNSQDRLLSQFYNAPLLVNPAYTGLMEQDYRVQTLYRDQWKQLVPFKTVGVSADITLPSPIGKRGQFSAGLVFLRDQMAEFQTGNSFILSGAYRYTLDQTGRHKLAMGGQAGYVRKSLDYTGLYFENQIGGDHVVNTGMVSGENLEYNRLGYFVANAGLAYTFYISRRWQLKAGTAVFNLNRPREQFLAGGKDDAMKLPQRMLLTAGAAIWISEQLYVFPELLFVSQQGVTEVSMGSGIGYLLHKNRQNAISLMAGGWYRTNGTAIAMSGITYKKTTVMLSYDEAVSDMKELRNTGSVSGRAVGAYEISLIYKGFLNRAIPANYTLPCGIF